LVSPAFRERPRIPVERLHDRLVLAPGQQPVAALVVDLAAGSVDVGRDRGG
jgi:hypothetical protein